jgi:Transcriptional regulator
VTSPEALLGGRTRFYIIEALAQAKHPITAYQIAMAKGLDPSATYRCLVEFSNFGMVESETRGVTKHSTRYQESLEELQQTSYAH